MSWARVDDGFHDHPKVDDLSLAAVGLWTLCLTWAHRHRRTAILPGHVTEARVRKIAGKQAEALAAELVAARLWDVEQHIGGWEIHDFCDYLPKERDLDERKQAGRKGAAKRWERHSKLLADDMANDGSRASAPAFPTRPDPTRDVPQEFEGDRPVTLHAAGATNPTPRTPADARCSGHRGVADPGPCNGCRAARESEERKLEAHTEREKREHDARRIACTRCDGVWLMKDDGSPSRTKCDHRKAAS